jgi:hypothetical protein
VSTSSSFLWRRPCPLARWPPRIPHTRGREHVHDVARPRPRAPSRDIDRSITHDSTCIHPRSRGAGIRKRQEPMVVHGTACIYRHRASASCSCVHLAVAGVRACRCGWPRHVRASRARGRPRDEAYTTSRHGHMCSQTIYLACRLATSDGTGERHVHTGYSPCTPISPISSLMVGCMLRGQRCLSTHSCAHLYVAPPRSFAEPPV